MRTYDNIGTTDFFMNASAADVQILRDSLAIDWQSGWLSHFTFDPVLWDWKKHENAAKQAECLDALDNLIIAKTNDYPVDYSGVDISMSGVTNSSTVYHTDWILVYMPLPVPVLASFWIEHKVKP